MGQKYYDELAVEYEGRRAYMLETLDMCGIKYFKPQGAYYVFSDISEWGYGTDMQFTEYLVKEIGVAVVPGASFFGPSELARRYVRFCFSRKEETLVAAREKLLKLKKKA
jgi:aminotransferase